MDWEKFSDDALLRIFHYLPIPDRVHLELVNKRWRMLLQKSWVDVNSLIVWKNGIYEELTTDIDVDPAYVTSADVYAVENVLKKSGGNLKSLKFIDTCGIDEGVVTTITQWCRNLEELELHKVVFPEKGAQDGVPIVENLLTLPKLALVAWNRNSVYDDIHQLQRQQNRRDHNHGGGVQMSLFPSVNEADAFTVMRGLRSLHLENVPLLWGNFVFICVQLAPTLEEFCFKLWDHFLIPLRCTLVRGLQHLVNLRQLNVGGDRNLLRPLGGLVDDEFAMFVAYTMPRMERLSVKASERLSIKGVKALIQNLPRLTYLNLNQCESINNSVLEAACESRSVGQYLTIYTNETNVSVEKLNIKSDHVSVLSNARFIDETVFFGEATLVE